MIIRIIIRFCVLKRLILEFLFNFYSTMDYEFMIGNKFLIIYFC